MNLVGDFGTFGGSLGVRGRFRGWFRTDRHVTGYRFLRWCRTLRFGSWG